MVPFPLCSSAWLPKYQTTIEFFLPVTIVIIPDVLVTNLITKLLLIMFGCDGISDHASWNEVFHYGDTKLSWQALQSTVILFSVKVSLIFQKLTCPSDYLQFPIWSILSRPNVWHPSDVTKTRSTSKPGLSFQSTIQKAYQWPAQFTPAHVFIPEVLYRSG